MKNSDYLEKYGQKALQLLNKKSLKHTVVSDLNIPSDFQDTHQHELDHKDKKLTKPQKSHSNKSLNRASKSKSKISIGSESQFTFQKPLNLGGINDKDKNRKKLIISGLSTPKNNRSARMVSAVQQQRIQGSSTKKKATDLRITQKLSEALLFKQKSMKSIVKRLLECLDMISEHECKINKWISQLKDIMYHVAEQATSFRKKYKEEVNKNRKMQKQLEEYEISFKIGIDKKRKPMQALMMEQNQRLRDKVKKLEQKLENFERKQIILIQTFQKLKGQGAKSSVNNETNSSSKKQREQNYMSTKIKKQFYGRLEEDEEEQSSNQSQENQ